MTYPNQFGLALCVGLILGCFAGRAAMAQDLPSDENYESPDDGDALAQIGFSYIF